VDRHGAVVVLDADPVAVAGGRAGVDHGAGHDGGERGADGVGDVDAVVHGAPARPEAGGEGAGGGADDGGRRYDVGDAGRGGDLVDRAGGRTGGGGGHGCEVRGLRGGVRHARHACGGHGAGNDGGEREASPGGLEGGGLAVASGVA